MREIVPRIVASTMIVLAIAGCGNSGPAASSAPHTSATPAALGPLALDQGVTCNYLNTGTGTLVDATGVDCTQLASDLTQMIGVSWKPVVPSGPVSPGDPVLPTGDYEAGTACDIAATAYISYAPGAQEYMTIGWVAPNTTRTRRSRACQRSCATILTCTAGSPRTVRLRQDGPTINACSAAPGTPGTAVPQ
jgi:hypothetical protein